MYACIYKEMYILEVVGFFLCVDLRFFSASIARVGFSPSLRLGHAEVQIPPCVVVCVLV